jgi:hypothetical protein
MKSQNPAEDAKLAAHDPDTIRRLITNQKHEHTPHAFRAGSSGMKDFNRLVPVLRSLPPDELVKWLKLIDQVGHSHRGCQPCTCKVRAYLILITKDILPDLHAHHLSCYHSHIKRWPPHKNRNFLAEVMASYLHDIDHPNAEAHKAWWKWVFEVTLRPAPPEGR